MKYLTKHKNGNVSVTLSPEEFDKVAALIGQTCNNKLFELFAQMNEVRKTKYDLLGIDFNFDNKEDIRLRAIKLVERKQ
jgi:hypothetical protein